MKKYIPLFIVFYSSLSFAQLNFDYRWDDYGLCGRYSEINGSFEGHTPFYCNPPDVDPPANGGPAKWRVYTDYKSKKKKCGEFTAGGFFVRDVNKRWYQLTLERLGDSLKAQYLNALKDPNIAWQLKPYVANDGTPSLVGFYCSRKEFIPNTRGKTKVVGAPKMLKRRRMPTGKYKGKCGFFRYRQGVKERFVGFFKREKFIFVPLNKNHCQKI